jgi:hypothetical protein
LPRDKGEEKVFKKQLIKVGGGHFSIMGTK